jgi:hypothetical protein
MTQIFVTKYCIKFWHTIMRLELQYLAEWKNYTVNLQNLVGTLLAGD